MAQRRHAVPRPTNGRLGDFRDFESREVRRNGASIITHPVKILPWRTGGPLPLILPSLKSQKPCVGAQFAQTHTMECARHASGSSLPRPGDLASVAAAQGRGNGRTMRGQDLASITEPAFV